MMLHRPNSPLVRYGPRSDPHPVRPQQLRRLSEANENMPVRPPRNPARPVTFGGEQPVLPSPVTLRPTTAPGDVDGRRKRIDDGDGRPANAPPPEFIVNRKQPAQTTPLPQINTLDRKILQELKRSMLARSAQFTLKNSIKHHPFPPDEVPYPRSYDHKCVDTDVWETVFCEQFCGNVTFHTFDVPPTKVLDLGCGSGSWIMACARQWKNCHFVGLDIVPLHPDLGQSQLSQRVSWVQANFLQPLPFPNEEFDFVHIKRIARGVPEDKWDALFEEIIRVMKPGAALEMLEEDLYIPGQMMETADNDTPPSGVSPSGSSDELSQSCMLSIPGPSTSLTDISSERSRSSFQTRRSVSERSKKLSLTSRTSSTLPPPLPIRSTPSNPENVRPFPLLKPKNSNSTVRPIASHFSLHSLLPKRSGRDDGAGADGDLSRKNKKESPVPVPLSVGLPASGSSAAPNQKNSAKNMRRPLSSGGRLPSRKLYSNATGTSSNLMLGSNATINILPMPKQTPHKFGENDPLPTLPPVGNTSGKPGVDFPRHGQNEDPRRARTRSFSCPTPEHDGRRRPSANRRFEPFDPNAIGVRNRAQQVPSLNLQNSNLLTDMESFESNRRRKKLTIIPPVPPPKDIPKKPNPQAIPSSTSSSDTPSPITGLSRSVPDRPPGHLDRNGDPFLSPAPGSSKPMKSLSTSSLVISTSRSTGPVPPSQQNSHSSDNSGADVSPTAEIPLNPRQHKLLQVMYTEMHATRFVNLAPLSLLENYVRTYFKNVRTHAPLIFTFPPPPGCRHRPELDATELSPLISAFPPPPGCEDHPEFDAPGLRQEKLNRAQKAEDSDDQDRYLGPDISPSTQVSIFSPAAPRFGSPKSIPPRLTRERSLSVASKEPGPSRERSSSTKSSRPSTANQPRSRGSRFVAGHGPDRMVVTGDELLTGTSEYVVMDRSMIGGLSPARAARAAKKSASSASDERERSRLRSDSLFTRSSDAKGKGKEGETRKRLSVPSPMLIRSLTAKSLPPPPSFDYQTSNATSSTSLSPSVTSSSSSTIIQSDSGKGRRGSTAAERAQLSTLTNKKAEIDVRSLNLHLRARVIEILGCSEAMWDWVKELQYQESEKERQRKEQERQRKEQADLAARTVQGVGGGRVSYYHRDRVKSVGREKSSGLGGDQSILHRKRSAKSFTTNASREKRGDDGPNGDGRGIFVKVPGYIPKSPTSASCFTTSPVSTRAGDLSEHMEESVKQELLHMTRERFDEVLSWFQFDMDDSIRLTRSMATRTSSSPFTTDPTEQRKSFDAACQKLESYLQQHPQRPDYLIKPNSIANGCESSSRSPQHNQNCEDGLCCLPPLLNLVHPSKRLCRKIRVWVAWKP